ncbi:MAG: DUF58 domain-containing protein [Planctomycetes bacterium]|nr:DUF58 domain-containing protein [Planctomycetota bacterium]
MVRLFDSGFIKRVGALRLRAHSGSTIAGAGGSGPASARAGFDINDSRPYSPGDDLRALDWNALARLDVPMVKYYSDAAPPEIHIVLDRSRSMGFWNSKIPYSQKDACARRLAGALGIVAIASGGAPRLAGVRDAASTAATPAGWLGQVEEAPPEPCAELLDSIRTGAASAGRRREWVLLSDLYDSALLQPFVERACARGARTTVCAVWSALDLEPPESAAEVRDAETGERRMFTSTGREQFIMKRDRFIAAWTEHCKRSGAGFIIINADESWEASFIKLLTHLNFPGAAGSRG